jgi:hypothetical protein
MLNGIELKTCEQCNHYHHRWVERNRLAAERKLVPNHPLVQFYAVVQDVRESIAFAYPRYVAAMTAISNPKTRTKQAYAVCGPIDWYPLVGSVSC